MDRIHWSEAGDVGAAERLQVCLGCPRLAERGVQMRAGNSPMDRMELIISPETSRPVRCRLLAR